ncbi:MAG: hypothetical protein WDW38_003125 [Sanguina aurantia]
MQDVPIPGSALLEELDNKLLLQLRDGRKIIGILRSFDQFANIVLDEAVERMYVGDMYADIPLGLQLVRGENVVLLGQIDPDKEIPATLRCVPEAAIREALKHEKEFNKLGAGMRARMDFCLLVAELLQLRTGQH